MRDNGHILMVTPFYSPNVGGVETHLDDLIRCLASKNQNVHVVTYQPLTSPKAVKAPFFESKGCVKVVRLPWPRRNLFYRLEGIPLLQFIYLFPGIFFLSLMYLLVHGRKISVIHGHGLAASVVTLLLSKLFGKKGVVSLHTIYKFSERHSLAKVVRRLLAPLDSILALAASCKEDLENIGIPREKISVYTCWVNNDSAFVPRDRTECRKILGLPREGLMALFIGRLSPEKGVETVLDVIRKMAGSNMFFVIVGDGPMRDKVKETARECVGLIAAGSVPYDRLMYYYGSADVLLFGSVDQDYYGRVTMEALSCGLPVIIPDSTAYFGKASKVRMRFPEGEIGFMTKTDAGSTASVLERFTRLGESDLNKMKENARSFALENFSERNAEVFFKEYGG